MKPSEWAALGLFLTTVVLIGVLLWIDWRRTLIGALLLSLFLGALALAWHGLNLLVDTLKGRYD